MVSLLSAVLLATGLITGVGLVLAALLGPAPPPAAGAGGGPSPPTRRRRARPPGPVVRPLPASATLVAVGWSTGRPAVAVLAAAVVLGLPGLLTAGRRERQSLASLVAVHGWTLRLANLTGSGVGLRHALIRSADAAPALIRRPVWELAAALRAGAPLPTALYRFADTLDDATVDTVVATLLLHTDGRGPRLGRVLTDLADHLADEVSVRRTMAEQLARPRWVAKTMTGLTATVAAWLVTGAGDTGAYATTAGQLALLTMSVAAGGLLAWARWLCRPAHRPRLLTPMEPTGRAG